MRKKFLTNLVLLLFLNFLIKPFWIFGIDRTVQNVVGAESYGFYFTLLNFAFLFQILLDLGITNYNNRNIAQNNHLLNKHFSSIIILRLLFSALYLLVIMCVGVAIGYKGFQLYLLFVIGINQFLLAFILYLRSNISALLLFKTDSLISVLDRLFMIAICSVLLWLNFGQGTFKIEWFVYAQTFAYLATAAIAMLVVMRKSNFLKLNWDVVLFKDIIRQSLPYALLILLMGLYNRADSVFIERLLGTEGELQSGIYASAFRLLDAANNMSGYLFSVLLLPIFAKILKQKGDVSSIIRLSFTLLFLVSITAAFISLFYKNEVMQLLYHQHSEETILQYQIRIRETATIFSVLMFSYISISTTYIFGTLLTANGSLKVLNYTAAFGVLLSVVLNFALIPTFKALGAAYASLVAQSITAILQLGIAFYILKLTMNKAYLIKLLAFVALVFGFSFIAPQLPFHWIFQIVTILISSVIVAFALRLLALKSLLSILKNE